MGDREQASYKKSFQGCTRSDRLTEMDAEIEG